MSYKHNKTYDKLKNKVTIKLSPKVKDIHYVVHQIIFNLAELDFINFINVSPEQLLASNEVTQGHIKKPITEPNHSTAIGVYLIIDIEHKNIQFFEITSATKGCGKKIVDAVLQALPEKWFGVVVMDWSQGFWKKMKEKYNNLIIF